MVCVCCMCLLVLWYLRSVVCVLILFFVFKQKTAYELLRSLVGSEMCIRDRCLFGRDPDHFADISGEPAGFFLVGQNHHTRAYPCLLYTSDAADDLLCVDLGDRRIIKKKTNPA